MLECQSLRAFRDNDLELHPFNILAPTAGLIKIRKLELKIAHSSHIVHSRWSLVNGGFHTGQHRYRTLLFPQRDLMCNNVIESSRPGFLFENKKTKLREMIHQIKAFVLSQGG